MVALRDWLKEKTTLIGAMAGRFAATASTIKENAFDVSRRDAIRRVQQLDHAYDISEHYNQPTQKDAAISVIASSARAAVLADLSDVDRDSVLSLVDALMRRDFVRASLYIENIMDSAGFAGGADVEEEKVIRLCEERTRRNQELNLD